MNLVESWGGNPIGWLIANIIEGVPNLFLAIFHWRSWLDWLSWQGTAEDKESVLRFIYYGASVELFFVLFDLVVILTILGIVFPRMMWAMVRGLEAFGNGVGRVFAWAGFLMVMQQVVIIFMQRVFAVSQLSFGFGMTFTKDVSWWSEELKFYNAMVVTLCLAYTFIQGGQVRVDLVYAAVRHRTKRAIDMFGSLFFMIPAATLIWIYAWFFQWRHLIVPNTSASDTLERLLPKARAMRWSVETIGFSPNGFNAYFLFKTLLLVMTAMIVVQAVAFFWRNVLEFREGEASADKYLDKDVLDGAEAEMAHAGHASHTEV
ncbi:TRAP transporter small permease subunit [Pseudoroseicyclus sp. CXY001]|uniref:TRAP transporter small permease subunit n=1 Tax=Pseudoroseicyclus sp. CXY001 TaxID=3242492 RepID=UPI00358DCCBE